MVVDFLANNLGFIAAYAVAGLFLAEGAHWAKPIGAGPYLILIFGWPLILVSLLFRSTK